MTHLTVSMEYNQWLSLMVPPALPSRTTQWVRTHNKETPSSLKLLTIWFYARYSGIPQDLLCRIDHGFHLITIWSLLFPERSH